MVHSETGNGVCSADGGYSGRVSASLRSSAPGGLPDETNRQLIKKRSTPAKLGSPEHEDYEYRRCSVVDLFVAFEPLACKRVVKLTDTRIAVDFAHFLREMVEVHYSHCEKIVLVMDNLNIHSITSLYKAFKPAAARQIAQCLEIHYTPIHASWLNMAEIEIGILSKQYLSQSLSFFELMARQVKPSETPSMWTRIGNPLEEFPE